MVFVKPNHITLELHVHKYSIILKNNPCRIILKNEVILIDYQSDDINIFQKININVFNVDYMPDIKQCLII